MTVFLRTRRDLTLIGESTAMAIGGSLRGCGVRQDGRACPDHFADSYIHFTSSRNQRENSEERMGL